MTEETILQPPALHEEGDVRGEFYCCERCSVCFWTKGEPSCSGGCSRHHLVYLGRTEGEVERRTAMFKRAEITLPQIEDEDESEFFTQVKVKRKRSFQELE